MPDMNLFSYELSFDKLRGDLLGMNWKEKNKREINLCGWMEFLLRIFFADVIGARFLNKT